MFGVVQLISVYLLVDLYYMTLIVLHRVDNALIIFSTSVYGK